MNTLNLIEKKYKISTIILIGILILYFGSLSIIQLFFPKLSLFIFNIININVIGCFIIIISIYTLYIFDLKYISKNILLICLYIVCGINICSIFYTIIEFDDIYNYKQIIIPSYNQYYKLFYNNQEVLTKEEYDKILNDYIVEKEKENPNFEPIKIILIDKIQNNFKCCGFEKYKRLITPSCRDFQDDDDSHVFLAKCNKILDDAYLNFTYIFISFLILEVFITCFIVFLALYKKYVIDKKKQDNIYKTLLNDV